MHKQFVYLLEILAYILRNYLLVTVVSRSSEEQLHERAVTLFLALSSFVRIVCLVYWGVLENALSESAWRERQAE